MVMSRVYIAKFISRTKLANILISYAICMVRDHSHFTKTMQTFYVIGNGMLGYNVTNVTVHT